MEKNNGIASGVAGLVGLVLLVIALGFVFFTFGWVNVKPTQVAVEIDKIAGKVKQEPLGVGYHFFNRFATDMVIYDVNARAFPGQSMGTEGTKEYNMSVKTNDGQNVSVDFTVIFSLNSKDVPLLHQTVGQNYEDQVLLPQVRSEARIAIGGYPAEDIYQGKVREDIKLEELQETFKNLRFTLNPATGKKYPHVTDILYWDTDFYINPDELNLGDGLQAGIFYLSLPCSPHD